MCSLPALLLGMNPRWSNVDRTGYSGGGVLKPLDF